MNKKLQNKRVLADDHEHTKFPGVSFFHTHQLQQQQHEIHLQQQQQQASNCRQSSKCSSKCGRQQRY
jgi:hypothetical protein